MRAEILPVEHPELCTPDVEALATLRTDVFLHRMLALCPLNFTKRAAAILARPGHFPRLLTLLLRFLRAPIVSSSSDQRIETAPALALLLGEAVRKLLLRVQPCVVPVWLFSVPQPVQTCEAR